MKLIDLKGRKFGTLTVLERDYSKNWKRPYWKCSCKCGNTLITSSIGLISGKTISCKKRKLDSGEASFNMLFRNYKTGAKIRGLLFSLTKEEFKKLTLDECYYCGEHPFSIIKKGSDTYTYNGIDRIDNNKGYEISNVVSSFLSWVDKIYNHSIRNKGD